MPDVLTAGAARRIINPPLGMSKGGTRLFGDPIQAIESDLTATALVLANRTTTLTLIATDLGLVSPEEASELRETVARTLGIPVCNVLLNLSHNHSAPAFPDFMSMVDSADEAAARERYKRDVAGSLAAAALEARGKLRPARIATGWGESHVGVYRREQRDGRDVLGEVPLHPIDASVGVIRIDDLDGRPIAVAFRYSAHPVTVGPRSMVASTDYPGPARDVVEGSLGGLALFLQGCGGNINPAAGIGYEVDCRDTKNRIGFELGGEVLKVAAALRTDRRPGARTTLGSVPSVLFTPWEPVAEHDRGDLRAAEGSVGLDFVGLPTLDKAREVHARWQRTREEALAGDGPAWAARVARKYEHWSSLLVDAVQNGPPRYELCVQALRIDDLVVVGMNVETFFETGLDIRAASPYADTFVLGYTNGLVAYLPRAEDYPEGGWELDASYAVPDLIPQAWQLPVAFTPDSERRAVALALELVERVGGPVATGGRR